MAAHDSVGTYEIVRCPVCLRQLRILANPDPKRRYDCSGCKRPFARKDALPAEGDVAASSRGTVAHAYRHFESPPAWALFGVALLLFALGAWLPWASALRGPGFLGFYAVTWLALFLGQILLRKPWPDATSLRVVAFLVFEGIGLARFFLASEVGMTRFGYMLLMMLIGGFVFFIDKVEGARGGGKGGKDEPFFIWSGCGGASAGCGGGGGGCGGGGCGGCS